MSKAKPKPNPWLKYFPWLLVALLAIGLIVLLAFYRPSTPLEVMQQKSQLLSQMHVQLLEAIESEKNAVLAPDVSQASEFAAKTRQASQQLESSRKQIAALIAQGNYPQEQQELQAFDQCWTQFRQLDETLLDYSVQNTNVRARKLSAGDATQSLQQLETHLDALGSASEGAARPAQEVLIAGLKILTLHKPHIESAQDAEMNQLETAIRTQDQQARKALRSLSGLVPASAKAELAQAEKAYEHFMALTTEVLKLSRQNTNVRSEELSLGKKRLISAQCQQSLAALQKTVADQDFKATR